MRLRFRKNRNTRTSNKEDPNVANVPSASSNRKVLEPPDSSSNQVVFEGFNNIEVSSMVSSCTQAESISENLVILLSIHSMSGLTISAGLDGPASNSGKQVGSSRHGQSLLQRKIKETLALKPTTVVVSVERELTKDGYPMETYIPSLALSEKNLWKTKFANSRVCSAYWPDAETADDRSVLNKAPPSTIMLNRKMKRVVYQREHSAERVSHFRHKRIDLNISLSRGTEMLRLGMASIAVAGDEEEEQLINVPIRPRTAETSSSPRVRCWTPQQKTEKNCFLEDPMQKYSLAENATLCLGVRVIAEDIIQHEELIEKQERIYIMESHELQESLETPPVIRLSDENELITTPSLLRSDSQLSLYSTTGEIPFLSCCAADTMSFSSMLSKEVREEETAPASRESKTTEATVTPIYLLSDMSESTAELTHETDEDSGDEESEEATNASSVLYDA